MAHQSLLVHQNARLSMVLCTHFVNVTVRSSVDCLLKEVTKGE